MDPLSFTCCHRETHPARCTFLHRTNMDPCTCAPPMMLQGKMEGDASDASDAFHPSGRDMQLFTLSIKSKGYRRGIKRRVNTDTHLSSLIYLFCTCIQDCRKSRKRPYVTIETPPAAYMLYNSTPRSMSCVYIPMICKQLLRICVCGCTPTRSDDGCTCVVRL